MWQSLRQRVVMVPPCVDARGENTACRKSVCFSAAPWNGSGNAVKNIFWDLRQANLKSGCMQSSVNSSGEDPEYAIQSPGIKFEGRPCGLPLNLNISESAYFFRYVLDNFTFYDTCEHVGSVVPSVHSEHSAINHKMTVKFRPTLCPICRHAYFLEHCR